MVYRSWALRGGLVRQISQAAIVRSGALAGTKLGLGIFGGGIVALFVAELVGACTSVLKLMHATRNHFAASKPGNIGFTQLHQIGAKFAKFPKLETPSAWLDALSMLLPLPLVAGLYGIEAAGWFGLARMVVSLPNAQIGAAVADVFQMELAKAVRQNEGPLARALFYTLFKKMSWIGLIPLVGTVVILPWAFPFLFGQSWEHAGLIAASLSPWLYAAFVVSPLSRALSVLQAQEWKLMYDITSLSLLVGCYFFSKTWGLSLIEFCLLLSLVKAVGYAVYAAVLFKLINDRLKNAKVE
jgi:O-antigen/teichoic acid export membrane protein